MSLQTPFFSAPQPGVEYISDIGNFIQKSSIVTSNHRVKVNDYIDNYCIDISSLEDLFWSFFAPPEVCASFVFSANNEP